MFADYITSHIHKCRPAGGLQQTCFGLISSPAPAILLCICIMLYHFISGCPHARTLARSLARSHTRTHTHTHKHTHAHTYTQAHLHWIHMHILCGHPNTHPNTHPNKHTHTFISKEAALGLRIQALGSDQCLKPKP